MAAMAAMAPASHHLSVSQFLARAQAKVPVYPLFATARRPHHMCHTTYRVDAEEGLRLAVGKVSILQ